jgi:precorrin-2 dehydrogenase / sirohydrochlorin ferrochelatase
MRLHVHLDVGDRSVLVVGAGRAGVEKARRLAASGARVTVVDPAVHDESLTTIAEVLVRPFRATDVVGRWLVVAAADSDEVNDAIEDAATVEGVWVNRADRSDGGSAALAASLDRGRIQVAVSTGGASPTLARWVRDRIDEALPAEIEVVADLLADARREGRPRGHRSIPIEDILGAIRSGDVDAARRLVNSAD